MTCFKCGEQGHASYECPNADASGKGVGKYGGKDAGKKGSGKKGDGGKPGGKKPGKKGGGDSGLICHRCGKPGHRKRECRSTRHKDGTPLGAVTEEEQQEEGAEPETEIAALSLSSMVSLNMLAHSTPEVPLNRARQNSSRVQGLETRSVTVGVDSGAGVTVWPKDLCKDYPTLPTEASRAGVAYTTAGSSQSPVKNLGERTLTLDVGGEARSLRAQVADVRKPLISVAEMCDAGHDVHFLSNGRAYSVHAASGKVTPFTRRKGVFELEATVPRYTRKTSPKDASLGK